MRGVIYARQSKTREQSESRDDQVDVCRRTAQRFGVDIVHELVEPPSTSGYKNRGRSRPRWAELLDLLRNGAVDCVIVYTTARLSRGGIPSYADLFDAAEKGGLDVDRLVLTGDGWRSELDLSIRASMDREDSKAKARQQKEIHAKLARNGKFKGGRRPFGFLADGVTHHPTEAAEIRDAARRRANGETWEAIAADWRERGLTSSRGQIFHPPNLAKLIRSDRVAGYRVHLGRRYPAAWEPIIDADLAEIVSRRETHGAIARRALLGGYLVCSKCDAKMRAQTTAASVGSYKCPLPNYGGCGGTRIAAEPLEELVRDIICEAVDGKDLAKRMAKRGSDVDERSLIDQVRSDRESLEQLSRDHYVDRLIGRGQFLASSQELERRIAAAERRLARSSAADRAAEWLGRGVDLRVQWDAGDLAFKRTILDLFIERIVVGPAVRGRNYFDADRITPERLGDVVWRV